MTQSEPIILEQTHVSDEFTTKSLSTNVILNFSYHCLSASFSPYKDFLSLHIVFSCPEPQNPQVESYRSLPLKNHLEITF